FLVEGHLAAWGSFEELKKSCPTFNDFVQTSAPSLTLMASSSTSQPLATGQSQHDGASSMISAEEYEQGEISLTLYLDYFKAMAKFSKKLFPRTLLSLLLISVLAMLIPIVQNKFLSNWTQSAGNSDLWSYGVMGLLTVGVGVLQHFYWSNKAITAGESLHNSALQGLLTSSMAYFDANPSGRILNRFSRDLDAVEKDLSWSLEEAFMAFLNGLGSLLVMLIAIPMMMVAVLP